MKSVAELIAALDELERKLYAQRHLNNTVYIDADTAAPSGSAAGRSVALEYLNNLQYELTTSKETEELLRELVSRKDELSPLNYRRASYLLEQFEKNAAVPQEEYVAYNVLLNDAEAVWHKAKLTNDFASYAPYLEKIIEFQIRFTQYWDPKHEKDDPYDVLLDLFEKGMTSADYDKFFDALKKGIVPLVHKISEKGYQPDSSFLFEEYPLEKQRQLSDYLMERLTIDRTHCAIAETEHPFTDTMNKDDVRITTHYYLNDPMSSFFSVMHEGGHALYELNTGDDLRYSILADGASSGVHESQSRFFENMIGRSREYLTYVFPKMQELFPEQFAGKTAEDFYKAANRSEPTLIRIHADELTYCLHIMLRYEIEKALVHREIKVADLPRIWKEKVHEYLGIDVPDDTRGVLQDSHWACGNYGYFPTYALGNAYAAQTAQTMSKDVDIAKCCAEGNLEPVVSWLTEHIYQYGSLYDPSDLMRRCWGTEFTPQPYIDYLTKKYTDLYL